MGLMGVRSFAPESFVAACDKFVYTEVLRPEAVISPPVAIKPAAKAENTKPPKAQAPAKAAEAAAKTVVATPPIKLIRQAIEEESDETGWANLGAVGSYLTKIRADFDLRLYGHAKLSSLFKKNSQYFVVEERSMPGVSSKVIYVKVV